ncbi:MAG TPA: protein-disulfide reductase DsbD domain-containing protein, partial [Stellaceae bacterium]|nr:protein-disulfide reductase DsbD domain-containing protein [Stellaceae bacterium]
MRLILHIFLPLLLIAACPAYAADVGAVSPWAKTPQAAVRLVAAPATNATSGPDAGTIRLGLEFDLAAGWKTYWRSPGDAGFPASIDWKGSSNVKPGPLDWPVPTRYSLQGLETFGYEGRLVLPLTAMRTDPTKPTHLSATVDFLTCATLCVPNHVDLALDLAPGAVPAGQAPLLDHWMARVPTGFRTDLTIISAASGGIGRSAFLDILVGAAPPMASPDVMIEGDGAVVSRPPQVIPQSPVTAVLRLTDPSDKDGALAKLSGKHIAITVVDRATLGAPTPRAVTHADVPVLHAETAAQSANSVPLSRGILLAALLGGLILNVMPCVLPVLSLKVLGLAGLNHVDRRRRRLGFVAGAAGIVVSFMALGIVLAVAKAAGQSIGWGVQFQHPLFLSTLAAITTAFAGNLFGWFEVPMPSLGLPASRSGEPSLLGHFVTGIFATVLATPCSAPFLGTAVGFALAGSIGDIMAVFLCLGLGFALPQ